jgi:hypothetical protein
MRRWLAREALAAARSLGRRQRGGSGWAKRPGGLGLLWRKPNGTRWAAPRVLGRNDDGLQN